MTLVLIVLLTLHRGSQYLTFLGTVSRTEAKFHGCTSIYHKENITIVPCKIGVEAGLSTTTVSRPLSMWALPITIAFQQQDLKFFPASTTLSSVTQTVFQTTATSGSTGTTSSPSPAITTQLSERKSSTLSPGTIAGIAIPDVAVLAILIGFAFWFGEKRSRKTAQLVAIYADPTSYEKHDQSSPLGRIEPSGISRPPEELDAEESRKSKTRHSWLPKSES